MMGNETMQNNTSGENGSEEKYNLMVCNFEDFKFYKFTVVQDHIVDQSSSFSYLCLPSIWSVFKYMFLVIHLML